MYLIIEESIFIEAKPYIDFYLGQQVIALQNPLEQIKAKQYK